MMKKRLLLIITLIITLLFLCSCTGNDTSSYLSVQFIDVGQGDSALIECDGKYMLIDGGDKNAGDKVHDVLKEKNINKLEILAISHMHADHIAGLSDALKDVLKIGITIGNKDYGDNKTFVNLESRLIECGCTSIKVPREGDIFKLGSAEIEVVDVSSEGDNDSLVLMINYFFYI